jgi:predicted RNase H-like HicB family nuclease
LRPNDAAFPELVSHGDTLEARAMARKALGLRLEAYREEGLPVPPSDADPRTTIREIVPAKSARL